MFLYACVGFDILFSFLMSLISSIANSKFLIEMRMYGS